MERNRDRKRIGRAPNDPPRIVSGGQSGVDRAALDAALALGLPCGGWCPAGRGAEDGPLPPRYPLRETPRPDPAQRTEWNVRDSDATLVLLPGTAQEPDPRFPGTALTIALAQRLGKPCRVEPLAAADPGALRAWIGALGVRTLNVAGPRESEAPGIQAEAEVFLRRVLAGRGRARPDGGLPGA